MVTTAISTIADLRASWERACEAKEAAHAIVLDTSTSTRQRELLLRQDEHQPSASRREMLRAQIELAELEDALAARQLKAMEADEAEREALAALREAIAADVYQRRRPVVKRLAALLSAARVEADALSALQEDSPWGDSLLWPAIQSPTKTFQPQLDLWLERCRSYGLLDDESENS